MFVSSSAFAAPKCAISIREELLNGQVKSTSFKSEMKSERACAVIARFHRPNFSPENVRVKHVAYAWKNAKPTAQFVAYKKPVKRSSSLALRKTRNRS